MANDRRLSISLRRGPALTATRVSIGRNRLVYVLAADRRFKYPTGKSNVVYIGTTRQGAARVAHSVAYLAEEILGSHGVRSVTAHVVTCRPRQRVRTWLKLERAMLIIFREMYGTVPEWNSHGKKMKAGDEFEYFARARVRAVLEELA